jgi:hypothetical protein
MKPNRLTFTPSIFQDGGAGRHVAGAVGVLRELYRKVLSEVGHHATVSQLTIENS